MSEFRPPLHEPGRSPFGDDDPTVRTRTETVPAYRDFAGLSTRARRPRLIRRIVRLTFWTATLALAAILALLVVYRFVDPPTTTLILGQRLAGIAIDRRPVPLARVSPNLLRAVIASEDGQFCRHRGVDWRELGAAIDAGQGGARGGSTISMQVVKNLFLWPSKSYVRKALEIPLTLVMELLWPKQRIMEVYLNIAEWGPGVFGAEAASRHHFNKPARALTEQEAALLAVSLPNPAGREAGDPGPGTQRLADRLLVRMRAIGTRAACVTQGAAGR